MSSALDIAFKKKKEQQNKTSSNKNSSSALEKAFAAKKRIEAGEKPSYKYNKTLSDIDTSNIGDLYEKYSSDKYITGDEAKSKYKTESDSANEAIRDINTYLVYNDVSDDEKTNLEKYKQALSDSAKQSSDIADYYSKFNNKTEYDMSNLSKNSSGYSSGDVDKLIKEAKEAKENKPKQSISDRINETLSTGVVGRVASNIGESLARQNSKLGEDAASALEESYIKSESEAAAKASEQATYQKYIDALEELKNEKTNTEYKSKSDFDEYSTAINNTTTTDSDADIAYKYINNINGLKDSLTYDTDSSKSTIGNMLFSTAETLSNFKNTILGEDNNNIINKLTDVKKYQYITDDEKNVFNYIYNKEGTDKASEYLDSLNLDKRNTEYVERDASLMAEKYPVTSSAISVGANLISDIGYLDNVIKWINPNENMNEYSDAQIPSKISDSIRETVSNKLDETKIGSIDVPLINQKLGSTLYNTVMPLADMFSAMAVGSAFNAGKVASGAKGISKIREITKAAEPIVLTIMSGQSATRTINDGLERGLSDNQAIALGTLSGIAEYVSEKIGLDQLLSNPTNAISYLLRTATVEGSEEVLSDIMNDISDIIVSGNKAEMQQAFRQYMSDGMDSNEAFAQVIVDNAQRSGTSFLGGFLSGLTMAVPGSVSSVVQAGVQNSQYTQLGNQLMDANKTDAVISAGKGMDELTEAYKKAVSASKYKTASDITDPSTLLNKYVTKKAANSLGKSYVDTMRIMDKEASNASNVQQEAEKTVSTAKDIKLQAETKSLSESPTIEKKAITTMDEGKELSKPTVYVDNTKTQILKIKDTQNGKTVVSLSNGKEADAEDIEYPNYATEQLFKSVGKYNKEVAQLAVDGYAYGQRSADVQTYLNAFDGYYNAATSGTPKDFYESYEAPEYTDVFTSYVKDKIYEYGTAKYNERVKAVKNNTVGKGTVFVTANNLTSEDKAKVKALKAIAGLTKTDIVVFSGSDKANGWYNPSTQEIHLNIKGDYDILQTASHELTHYIRDKSPSAYAKLKDYVLNRYSEIQDGKAVDILVKEAQDRAQNSKTNPHKLSYDEALEEVIANACQNMLTDTDAINELMKNDKGLFNSIREWINKMLSALKDILTRFDKNSKEYVWLSTVIDDFSEMREMWYKGLAKAVSSEETVSEDDFSDYNNSNIKYSIKYNKNNVPYVVIDEDILTNIQRNKWQETLKKNLKEKFPNGILVGNNIIGVNKESRQELAYSKNTNYYKNFDIQKYIDKLNAANSADEILKASLNYVNEEPLHFRKDKITNFARGDVLFVINGREYKADVIVGNTKSSVSFLYDIINLDNIDIEKVDTTDKSNNKTAYISSSPTFSDNNIPNILESVNENSVKLPDGTSISAFSLRESLYNALANSENLTANDKRILNNYKNRIEQLDSLQNRLKKVNSQIKNISFTKGSDRTNLESLNNTAKSIRNEIVNIDRKLLNIEKMQPIKNIVNEAVKNEYKQGKENLQQYKSDVKQTANRRKHLTSIESNAESLIKWIQAPKEGKSVPPEIQNSLLNFLTSIDFEKGKLNRYGVMTQHDKKVSSWKESMLIMMNSLSQETDGLPEVIPKSIADMFNKFISNESISNKRIYEMSDTDIETLDNIVKMVRHAIQNINNTLSGDRKLAISNISKEFIADTNKKKALDRQIFDNKVGGLLFWDAIDSFTFFKLLGSNAESVIFQNFRNAFNKRTENIEKADSEFKKITKDTDWKKWTGDKTEVKTFDVNGKEIKFTAGQVMYLYLVDKREKALKETGLSRSNREVVSSDDVLSKNKNSKKSLSEQDIIPVNIDDVSLGKILNTLTDEQKQVADALQKHLSTVCSALGNEVTRKLWGFDAYTESAYVPIFSSKDFLEATNEKARAASYWAIKNMSFTKSLVEGANNPIVIRDVFDVWAEHTADMIIYNAYTLPITDAMRWFNYKEAQNGKYLSVREKLHSTYTNKSTQYFLNLIEDINGTNAKVRDDFSRKLVSNAKSYAVGLNLSVVVQQPASYARALAVMNPKYLIAAPFKGSSVKLAKEYCPIAWWKSKGFYDVDIGRNMKDILTDDKTGLNGIKHYTMWLAEKADEITWGVLWNACELEISDTTDLKKGTEEFNQAVGKRLSEVIDQTQVVDTVFHKSQALRSDNQLLKSTVATFFTEPSKSYNVFIRSVIDYNNAKTAGERFAFSKTVSRSFVAYVVPQVLAGFAKSFITGLRDDDEDESYTDKWLEALLGNVLGNLNPLNMIPYANVISSILSDYDVTPLNLVGIEKAGKAINYLESYFEKKNQLEESGKTMSKTDRRKSIWDISYTAATSVSAITGIPISNLMRSFESLYNVVADENLASGYKVSDKYSVMYQAIKDGETDIYTDTYNRLIEDGYTDANIKYGIQKILRNDDRVIEAAQSRYDGNIENLDTIRNELISEGFDKNIVYGAVDSAYNDIAEANNPESEKTTEATETTEPSTYKYTDLISSIDKGYTAYSSKIVNQMKAEGKDDSSIRSALTKEYKERYFELKYQAALGNESSKTQLDSLKSKLKGLNIGYDSSIFYSWDKDYADWKKENKR